MVQMNQKWDKILELLFENTNKRFSVRQIAEKTKIPSSSVQRYLKELKKNGIIDKENKVIINKYTKFRKTVLMLDKIYLSGLINYISEKLVPETIILFGSVRKGEYYVDSDIDIFVSSTKKVKLDLEKFEAKLNHDIQLIIEPSIDKLPKHLYNNVVNGIKLEGFFKVK